MPSTSATCRLCQPRLLSAGLLLALPDVRGLCQTYSLRKPRVGQPASCGVRRDPTPLAMDPPPAGPPNAPGVGSLCQLVCGVTLLHLGVLDSTTTRPRLQEVLPTCVSPSVMVVVVGDFWRRRHDRETIPKARTNTGHQPRQHGNFLGPANCERSVKAPAHFHGI